MDLNEETFNTHANGASSMEEDVVPDQLQYNTRISDSTQHNHNAGYVNLYRTQIVSPQALTLKCHKSVNRKSKSVFCML